MKEYSENKFIGSNRKETLAFKITIQNTKSNKIVAKVFDQIPISNNKDIVVEVIDVSNAKMNKDSGELEWELTLNSKEIKTLFLKYSVKYPKFKKVLVH